MKKPELKISSAKGVEAEAETIFRLGETEDKDFIRRLSKRVFYLYGPYEEIIPRWFTSNKGLTITALLNGHKAGFAMIGEPFKRYELDNSSEILAIAVVPENQGKGLGEKLLKAIDNKAVDLKIKRLFLHTSTDNFSAQRLFKKAGYGIWQIRREFYPEGQDAFVMCKELAIQC